MIFTITKRTYFRFLKKKLGVFHPSFSQMGSFLRRITFSFLLMAQPIVLFIIKGGNKQ